MLKMKLFLVFWYTLELNQSHQQAYSLKLVPVKLLVSLFLVFLLICCLHFSKLLLFLYSASYIKRDFNHDCTFFDYKIYLRLGDSFREWVTPLESPTIIIGWDKLKAMWFKLFFFLKHEEIFNQFIHYWNKCTFSTC